MEWNIQIEKIKLSISNSLSKKIYLSEMEEKFRHFQTYKNRK